MWANFKKSDFYIKLTHWEFWNFYVIYFFAILYYIWLSIKSRTFFWFSASNPGIESGGMLGESKSKILDMIPGIYTPKYFLVYPDARHVDLKLRLEEKGINFPLIAKPDIGERGQGLEKILNLDALWEYHKKTRVAYLIQEFIDYPLELGVFYYRLPNNVAGIVSSIVIKDFLKVTGDGISTLAQLIENYPRARFRHEYLFYKFKDRLNEILPIDAELELENIGNHVRGTTFLDGNFMINEKLTRVFDEISLQINGFYYGRYDLRCTSIEDLSNGKNIKILELNGAGAEPAHIYQPGFSFWQGQKILLYHWKIMWQISTANHKLGIPYMTWSEARKEFRKHAEVIQKIKNL